MTIGQIETIQQGIIEHFFSNGAGYCEVPSASEAGKSYRVYFNEKLYSTSCNCKGGRHDCGHKVAVDRHFDNYRQAMKPAKPVVLYSNVCGHLVKSDVDSHCGCMA